MVLVGLVLAAAWMFVVLYWWSEGSIEASEAILLAGVFAMLIFGLFAARTFPQFLLAFIPLVFAAGYAIYSYCIGGTRGYYKRRCEDYMRAIRSDPRNLGARQYLAEALYSLGDLDRAVDEMQAAVDLGAGMECQYKLGKWSKERYFRDTTNPVCRWCETENKPGARKCSRCSADLPYDNALTRWLMGGKTATARYYLLVIIGTAIMSVSFLLLPPKFALIPVGLCAIALIGWSLVASARS